MQRDDDKAELRRMRQTAERDQLQPFKTPHSNAVLKGPGEDIGDLDCELALDTEYRSVATVSAWDLDEHQRELIAAGAHLRMTVWQHPIPPLALAVEAPFCPDDGVQTVYVRAVGAFCCPSCDPRFPGAGTSKLEVVGDVADDRDASRRSFEQAHEDFAPGDPAA